MNVCYVQGVSTALVFVQNHYSLIVHDLVLIIPLYHSQMLGA
jgi:hypothetical protein